MVHSHNLMTELILIPIYRFFIALKITTEMFEGVDNCYVHSTSIRSVSVVYQLIPFVPVHYINEITHC